MGKRLLIRNVPEGVYESLQRKAADEGLSAEEYLLAYLTELASRPSVREVLRRAAKMSEN